MAHGRAYAAIDCGTNSTRLLVVDRAGRAIERQMRITRLGEGVDATGMLAPAAINRCLSVLRDFREVMDRLEVAGGRLVATSAARDASNGREFLDAAGAMTGLEPELLSGIDEARLSLAGAISELDSGDGPFLVVDIGGGSTELMSGTGPHDPSLSAVSLQLGCVRLSERYLRSDPPTPGELHTAEAVVDLAMDKVADEHPRFEDAACLVGLAGTVSTLVSLDSGLETYDRALVHHAVLEADAVDAWYHSLASENRDARLDRRGMIEGREDVIVGGAMILTKVMRRFGFEECLVSESDILDGMAAGLVAS